MMMNIFFSIAFAILIAAAGCSSSGEAVKKASYPSPPADVAISLKRTSGGNVNVELAISGKGADTGRAVGFVRHIKEVRTILYHPELGLLDSLTYTLASSFATENGIYTMTLEALSYWENTLGIKFDSLYTQTFITERGGGLYAVERGFSLPPQTERQQAVPALVLKGWVEEATDSSALFVVLAERIRAVDTEYFPSSERLRVVLNSEDGTTLWNSSTVQIFMQMIAPVDPKIVGEVRRYETHWNGEDAQGRPLPPGRYTAVLTLPVRPSPYTVSIPFHWKVSDDE